LNGDNHKPLNCIYGTLVHYGLTKCLVIANENRNKYRNIQQKTRKMNNFDEQMWSDLMLTICLGVRIDNYMEL